MNNFPCNKAPVQFIDCCQVMDCISIDSSDNSVTIEKDGCGVDITQTGNNLDQIFQINNSGCVSFTKEFLDGVLTYTPQLSYECIVAALCELDSFEDCIQAHQTPETTFAAVPSSSIGWTAGGVHGHAPTAVVKISADANNTISIHADGIYSAQFVETTFAGVNTNSISWTPGGTHGHTPSANIIISPDGGNSISVHANGLYAATGSAVTADNGLNIASGPVELGGTLIKNTTIDFGASFQLNFTNTPRLSLGSTTTLTNTLFTVVNTDSLIQFPTLTTTTLPLSNTLGRGNIFSLYNVSGGAFTHTSNLPNFGLGGQLNFTNTGNISLFSGEAIYAGVYGVVATYNAANVTGSVISAGWFHGVGAGSGNVDDMAAIRALGIHDLDGTPYTGTVTNYYGLRIDDITNSQFGSRITNKFAIYQAGTADISRFFGPVQNASSSVQFTSDLRVKENISPFTRGLAEIKAINTKTFNYTYKKSANVVGVIAQELEQIMPEAVHQDNFSIPGTGISYTDFRFVDQNRLFYTMLNAIKELSTEIDILKQK